MNTQQLAHSQHDKAMAMYNSRYVNHAFVCATTSKSSDYANAIIDEALALCGDPHYHISRRRWSQAAMMFLELFA